MDNLATAVIIGCHYCYMHFDATRPRLKIFQLYDGSTVTIIGQLSKANTEVPLTEEQQLDKKKNFVSPKMKVNERIRLKLCNQTWFEASTQKEGTIMVEQYNQLYDDLLWLAGTWIEDLKQAQPLHILFVNFSNYEMDLLSHQVASYASKHQETIIESDIKHAEMLGRIPEDVYTIFRNWHVYAHDIATINKFLADQREQHMWKDENPLTAADIHLDVLHENEDNTRHTLRKREQMWSAQL